MITSVVEKLAPKVSHSYSTFKHSVVFYFLISCQLSVVISVTCIVVKTIIVTMTMKTDHLQYGPACAPGRTRDSVINMHDIVQYLSSPSCRKFTTAKFL